MRALLVAGARARRRPALSAFAEAQDNVGFGTALSSKLLRIACAASLVTFLTCGVSQATQIIRFNGNLTLTNNTIFNMSVNGPVRGTDYDSLAVAGQATLAGTLNFIVSNNFAPSVGEEFLAVSYGSHSGMFGSIVPTGLASDLFVDADYRSDGLFLTIGTDVVDPGPTSVPEPATLALLAAGLVGAGVTRRHRAV